MHLPFYLEVTNKNLMQPSAIKYDLCHIANLQIDKYYLTFTFK